MKTEHVIIGRRCILHYSEDFSFKRVVLEPVLAGEEKLLEQAEDIMELHYPEKANVFIQITPLYFSYADLHGVHYLAPYDEFLRISEGGSPGMPHEWAHFLALKLLCPVNSVKPPAFFLTEGLATAVDALANPKYS